MLTVFCFVKGIWRYRIERLGDSHQSHFVQVVTSTTASNAVDEFNVRLYSNVDETRAVNLSQMPLILYADVRRGMSPVLEADVEATVMAGTLKWNVRLFDSGNGGEKKNYMNNGGMQCLCNIIYHFIFNDPIFIVIFNRSRYHGWRWNILSLYYSTCFHSEYLARDFGKSENVSVRFEIRGNGLDVDGR